MTYLREPKIGNFKPPRSERKHKNSARDGEDKVYLSRLRQLPCVICGNPAPNTVHHLKQTGHRGVALRSPDKFGLPMCMTGFAGTNDCHGQVERIGSRNELAWFRARGIDAIDLCYALWSSKHSVSAMKKVLLAHKETPHD